MPSCVAERLVFTFHWVTVWQTLKGALPACRQADARMGREMKVLTELWAEPYQQGLALLI